MLQSILAMGYGSEAQGGTTGMIFMAVWLVVCLTILAGVWKVFTKAGQPGWGVLVPIYNTYLMTKIAQRPAWWLILMFIPVVNIIVHVVLSMDIARHFSARAPDSAWGWLASSSIRSSVSVARSTTGMIRMPSRMA